jgi:SAM-dependent methyltransferase
MNAAGALDLYARAEDLLGVREAAPKLYAHYLLALQETEFGSLLDVGCGRGEFVSQIREAFPGADFHGIDLSPEMVRMARERGVNADRSDLCGLNGSYDVITCVFDMLNYLSPDGLGDFMLCLRERLRPGGTLLCDINTLYGFEEVAVGAFQASDGNRFVAVEGDFSEGVYRSDFTLFERDGECWKRSDGRIFQYYHAPGDIASASGLELAGKIPVRLYSEEEADKMFLRLVTF